MGDPQIWKIFLDTTGVEPSTVPDFAFKNSFFSLSFDVDEDLRYYGQSSYLFEACVLKYKYLTYMVSGRFLDGLSGDRT